MLGERIWHVSVYTAYRVSFTLTCCLFIFYQLQPKWPNPWLATDNWIWEGTESPSKTPIKGKRHGIFFSAEICWEKLRCESKIWRGRAWEAGQPPAYLKTGREGDGRTRFRRVWSSRRAVSHRFAVRRRVPRYPSNIVTLVRRTQSPRGRDFFSWFDAESTLPIYGSVRADIYEATGGY
jgi:hypothetical protein